MIESQQQESAFKEVQQDGIMYLLNDEQRTASILCPICEKNKIIIPRSIVCDLKEYVVTSISENAFQCTQQIKSIQFEENSEFRTIEQDAFNNSSIESISIPSSLVDLKEGWCSEFVRLNKVTISPYNPRYSMYEDKFIIGKSSIEQEDYDVLVFAVRNIKPTVKIPSFIKIIGPHAFDFCEQLQGIEFEADSELRVIDKYAFASTSIESFEIPPKLVETNEGWCSKMRKLNKITVSPKNPLYCVYDENLVIAKSSPENEFFDSLVYCARNAKKIIIPSFIEIIKAFAFEDCNKIQEFEIPSDSKIRIIEQFAFYNCSVETIILPPSINKICECAFFQCRKLRTVEIPGDSDLEVIEGGVFRFSSIEELTIPSKLINLKESWACEINGLKKINVSPKNPCFVMYDDTF